MGEFPSNFVFNWKQKFSKKKSKVKSSLYSLIPFWVSRVSSAHVCSFVPRSTQSKCNSGRHVARNLSWGAVAGISAPSCQKPMRAWRQSPQPLEAKGSGGRAPSARQFLQFFNKNNACLGLNFYLKTCFDNSWKRIGVNRMGWGKVSRDTLSRNTIWYGL